MDPVRQSLLRANAGQCGRDTAHCSLQTVRVVATMDGPSFLAHEETSEASLYCAATFYRYGLPLRLRIGYRLFLYRDIYRDNIGIDIIGYDFENNRYNRLCFSK
jgi:hypothetical protein